MKYSGYFLISQYYLFTAGISLTVAHRYYWRHGDWFVSFEHNFLFTIVTTLQILSFWSHAKASLSDPGTVSKTDFIDPKANIDY